MIKNIICIAKERKVKENESQNHADRIQSSRNDALARRT